jgi:hypothetical protein
MQRSQKNLLTSNPGCKSHHRLIAILFLCVLAIDNAAWAQQRRPQPPPTPGAMLSDGTVDLDTPDFTLTLVRSSQTVAALKPKTAQGFDFTPGDILVERSLDGYHHLGDIELRVRTGGGDWKSYSTALERTPVRPLPTQTGVLASADLTATLPVDLPLEITRSWLIESGKLVVRFNLKNKALTPVEIGALGFSMIFNNVLNNRTLDQAHALCSFYDPYIGEDAGYLQVTRLSGHGPALIVVPDGHTPFEAYSPILSRGRNQQPGDRNLAFTDPTPRGVTFEGFYDWMVYSKAFAENEWKNAQQWNPATSVTLQPGEAKTYGLKFLVSDEIRDIEKTLAANSRPVAVGIPGYVLPTDIDARLFLKYPKPVKSLTVDPPGAITIQKGAPATGWAAYTLRGQTWGRARMTVTYADGLVQTIQYRVTKPEAQAVADMGHFLTTQQWFDDAGDPFHRAPSVMTYDREANHIVMQDSRVWIAGLSDEGGAGSWLAAMMKQLVEPDKEELDELQRFVDETLSTRIQYAEAPRQFGVRKSLFYYQPDELPSGYYRSDFNWTTWTSWNKKASEAVDRSFNYPHVAAAYWVMYRLSRNHTGLVTSHPWQWYLEHAAQTTLAMTQFARGYARFGQMEGDIFLEILRDLKREGMAELADQVEAKMRERADRWKQEAYPFGSEMPWDSTGQEEVYAWTKYFGYRDKAEVTLNAILGYMPTVPHWGYNGSARRYWDFIYGASAKYSRIERQLHHYGSGINAIPVLSEYRDHPDDFYLLRVGHAGAMGAITDIDGNGFLAPAFHAFPDMLCHDPVSGDNGPNFFGYAMNNGAYLVRHPEFGWVAFGGNISAGNGTVQLRPLDSARMRIYLAPVGLWLTLDSGTFDRVELNPESHAVRVALSSANQYTATARLRIEQPASVSGVGKYAPVKTFSQERDAYVVPLGKQITWVELNTK